MSTMLDRVASVAASGRPTTFVPGWPAVLPLGEIRVTGAAITR